MGDFFSDDFVTRWVIPGSYLLMLANLFRALFRVHSSLRDHAASWESRRAQGDVLNSLYRMPAASFERGPPARVRQLAYALVVWAVANVACWSSIAAFASLFGFYWFLIILPFSLVACFHVTQSAFSLCDREDERARIRIARTRTWIIVHHAFAASLGTLALGKIFLVFHALGGGSDWQTKHEGQVLGTFFVIVLLPSLLAYLFVRELKSLTTFYPSTRTSEG